MLHEKDVVVQDEDEWELPNEDDQMLAQLVDDFTATQSTSGLKPTDRLSLHYLCGYRVEAVCTKYKLYAMCKAALTDPQNTEHASLTQLKSYIPKP